MELTYVSGKPKLWLRLEGLVLLVSTIILFASQHQKWWLYPLLLLVPDVFMLGYLANTRVGAFFYNLGHSYLAPALMIFFSSMTINYLGLRSLIYPAPDLQPSFQT